MPKNIVVREPALPSVPLPPSMVKDEPTPDIAQEVVKKPKIVKKTKLEINNEYINSEFNKIDFYLDGGQVESAEEAYHELKKNMDKDQRHNHKYDFQRIVTSIELLKLK